MPRAQSNGRSILLTLREKRLTSSERATTFRHHGALQLAVAAVPVDNHPVAHPEQGVMTELELAPRPDSPFGVHYGVRRPECE